MSTGPAGTKPWAVRPESDLQRCLKVPAGTGRGKGPPEVDCKDVMGSHRVVFHLRTCAPVIYQFCELEKHYFYEFNNAENVGCYRKNKEKNTTRANRKKNNGTPKATWVSISVVPKILRDTPQILSTTAVITCSHHQPPTPRPHLLHDDVCWSICFLIAGLAGHRIQIASKTGCLDEAAQ